MWICDHFSARSIPSSPGPWVPGIKLGILYVLSYGKLWGYPIAGVCAFPPHAVHVPICSVSVLYPEESPCEYLGWFSLMSLYLLGREVTLTCSGHLMLLMTNSRMSLPFHRHPAVPSPETGTESVSEPHGHSPTWNLSPMMAKLSTDGIASSIWNPWNLWITPHSSVPNFCNILSPAIEMNKYVQHEHTQTQRYFTEIGVWWWWLKVLIFKWMLCKIFISDSSWERILKATVKTVKTHVCTIFQQKTKQA